MRILTRGGRKILRLRADLFSLAHTTRRYFTRFQERLLKITRATATHCGVRRIARTYGGGFRRIQTYAAALPSPCRRLYSYRSLLRRLCVYIRVKLCKKNIEILIRLRPRCGKVANGIENIFWKFQKNLICSEVIRKKNHDFPIILSLCYKKKSPFLPTTPPTPTGELSIWHSKRLGKIGKSHVWCRWIRSKQHLNVEIKPMFGKTERRDKY